MWEEKSRMEISENSRMYACWLYNAGIGRKAVMNLRRTWLDFTGKDPSDFAESIFQCPEDELDDLCQETVIAANAEWNDRAQEKNESCRNRANKMAERLLSSRKCNPAAFMEEAGKKSLKFCDIDAVDFPERLRNIPDPPYAVYFRGFLPDDAMPAVAIIGARMASGYGRDMAMKFGTELAESGIQVISGMARGVDSISQRAAIGAHGKSYAVLGCGADICYPKENRELYDGLPLQGGIISEYPPGTQPMARLFPSRNRIISALADLVLVIEARERSGSLITTDFALAQGKELFAVPGRISDPLAVGCNRLIRQGAGIATCPDDVIEAVCGVRKTKEDEKYDPDYLKKISLQEPERSLYEALEGQDVCDLSLLVHIAEERLHCTIRTQDAIRCMMELCMKGMTEEVAAGVYRKRCR